MVGYPERRTDTLLAILGALVAINPILSGARDVSVPLDPLGPLKVALDYALATTWPEERRLTNVQRNLQFSSHIVFVSRVGDSDEENPPVSDGQLWQIARDAQYAISKTKEPKAMGILAWGNEFIIASSIRGAGHFSYDFLKGETAVSETKVGTWEPTDPCGTDSEIRGSGPLVQAHPPAPYTLANLAGGPTRIEQIQLCGGQPRVFVG
ncbi:uncharacterized protein P174DRAFT_457637 [Aspergillus novofumigatus IBT 16806]|uniref:Uncharacterized protein n=1 Tax=Aspergillus novofumigatus (strain IBT 16806) TaxID=1392255 RepID=A0A2I1CH14_ASPN1|nr:uncharacterized protein P174DRAFT_457637 [Aspergillus novofumigatus IBT 16806]PKX96894.1 hypothetical protein P174DRAFT_457637 [Aspergillus novofumigatus IBT 16806]